MSGPGFAPTPPRRPHSAVLVLLRVLFVVLTVLSVGFLGWTAMLRIAVVRRRVVDWVLFCATLAATVGILLYIGTGETEEPRDSDVALILVVFLLAVVITTYYLIVDIRHFARLGRTPALLYGPSPAQQPYGYAYPPPYATPVPPFGHQQPSQPSQPSHSSASSLPQPQPQPQPQFQPQFQPLPPPRTGAPSASPQNPPRIDQVRAELDELSDLLRQGQEGREGRTDR
ncbi:hypothetical protein ACFYYH_21115 [Streptomyces sp. NPDC002018]|uniref:hypothetical protein n=1 Tax=Streptomyces sp. NPDC002018 TaxID=3364629 RepID=UPI003683A88E